MVDHFSSLDTLYKVSLVSDEERKSSPSRGQQRSSESTKSYTSPSFTWARRSSGDSRQRKLTFSEAFGFLSPSSSQENLDQKKHDQQFKEREKEDKSAPWLPTSDEVSIMVSTIGMRSISCTLSDVMNLPIIRRGTLPLGLLRCFLSSTSPGIQSWALCSQYGQ